MNFRRSLLLGAVGILPVALLGCANAPARSATAKRTYCIRRPRGRGPLCAADAIPSAASEAEAKRFESSADWLTLYVVRGRYADAIKPVTVTLDETVKLVTLPRSMARLRVAPGHHLLDLEWDGRVSRHEVTGEAGEVRFVELAGSAWPWERNYHWSESDPAGTKERALTSRLITDL